MSTLFSIFPVLVTVLVTVSSGDKWLISGCTSERFIPTSSTRTNTHPTMICDIRVGGRVIAKYKPNTNSNWFSGTVLSINRQDNTCEIKWDDNGDIVNVEFKWIRASRDTTTASHKDVGKNKDNKNGMEGGMWDGCDHRSKDLDVVINSYEPPLNVIEIQ